MTSWILVGGRLILTPALARLPRPSIVIAADGGARHVVTLQRAGWEVRVDAWVGDFDSSQGLTLDAPRQTHPRAKDSTDAELALRLAVERGAGRLCLIGAFGGRFDHSFALALGALRLAGPLPPGQGMEVSLHSGDESGYPLLPGRELTLKAQSGQTFSVLAASALRGLSVAGARWNLDRADVPLGSGHTLSNEASGGPLRLNLDAGLALVTLLEPGTDPPAP
ncbi:MAG: thiamine diphosphokinase [Deinococcus sp.]